MANVKHAVADSGAFIRNAPLQSIGEKVYSVPDVGKEIKDKATLQRLQVLPYRLQFKTPSPDSIRFVTEFSKKTGDYRSLSAVDIQVIALTYQLEKKMLGEIISKVQWTATKQNLEKATDIVGFYISKKQQPSRTTSECTVTSDLSESHDLVSQSEKDKQHSTETNTTESDNNVQCSEEDLEKRDTKEVQSDTEQVTNSNKNNVAESPVDMEHVTDSNDSGTVISDAGDTVVNSSSEASFCREGATIPSDLLEEEDSEEDEGIEEDDDDDDDDDGWITPSNIKSVKEKMGDVNTEKATVTVGCVTTDFAMQNVLIQMGLNVVSVDGMLIRRAKSYVQRCSACMKITMNMEKEFCPHCGNNTLRKVSMTVEEDGSIRYFLSCRRPMNTRGLKYSLPLPKGGKHAINPILVEDQPSAQQRVARKSRQKMDVFDPDYIAGQSPFSVTDITSRAAQLGIRGGRKNNFNKRNPNEVKKNYGRRK